MLHLLLKVICVHDVNSIYRVPLLLEKQGVDVYLSDRLQLKLPHRKKKYLSHWTQIADRFLQIILNLHLWDIFNNLLVACICS